MLSSISEIIEKLIDGSEKIKDENLKNKFRDGIDKVSAVPIENWKIHCASAPDLYFSAKASQQEIIDGISNYVKNEAEKDPVYFYSGEKTEEGKNKIFQKTLNNYIDNLGYSARVGSINSIDENLTETDFSLFGDQNQSGCGFSIFNQSRGSKDKYRDIQNFQNWIRERKVRKKDLENFSKQVSEFKKNNTDATVVSSADYGTIFAKGGGDFTHIDREIFEQNEKNELLATDNQFYERFDKKGSIVEIANEAGKKYNLKGNKIAIDTIEKEKISETIKCEDGKNLDYSLKTTTENVVGEKQETEINKQGIKQKKEKLDLEMAGRCEEKNNSTEHAILIEDENANKNAPLYKNPVLITNNNEQSKPSIRLVDSTSKSKKEEGMTM